MELHEILREWCIAAAITSEATEALGSGNVARARRLIRRSNADTPGMWRRWLHVGPPAYLERAQRDIHQVMSPSAPLAQRWNGTKRRQAGRRTLQSLMRIYCPDLLGDFEAAVDARVEWMGEHRAKIASVLRDGAADVDLESASAEMAETLSNLESVRAELHSVILHRFPIGPSQD
ncbi:hypothetical protein [Streptomyces nigrescens]|uniref:hypothetical protein n=1 Tax=Streptomyces nigrescens TaxID=1920 RepID=UPI003481175C